MRINQLNSERERVTLFNAITPFSVYNVLDLHQRNHSRLMLQHP